MQNHCLNILTFNHPQEELTLYFTNVEDENLSRINHRLVPDEVIEETLPYEQYSGTINDITDKSSESRYGIRFNRRNYTQSAKDLLGDDTLLKLARVLVERVKDKASIDWTVKESVKKKLKVIVKRTLRQYGYPPDLQKLATETVLQQAEALADFWN